jgi:hypothetical protein
VAKLREALKDARDAIETLDDDALGEAITGYDRHGNPEGYPLRNELLAKIEAALSQASSLQRVEEPTEEMIEHVARAIAGSFFDDESAWAGCVDEALAAITAIRSAAPQGDK